MDRGRPSRPAPRLAGGQHRITADRPDTRTCRELPLRHRPPYCGLAPVPSVAPPTVFVADRLREPPFAQARHRLSPCVHSRSLRSPVRLARLRQAPGRRPATGLWTTGITEPTNLTPTARIGHDRRLRLRRDPPQVVLTRETGWSYTREIRWSSSEEIGRSSIRKFCTMRRRRAVRVDPGCRLVRYPVTHARRALRSRVGVGAGGRKLLRMQAELRVRHWVRAARNGSAG